MAADLATGRIEVDISRSEIRPEQLFGFAQRRNPKRGFLFVSRVLGRHIPAKPSVMRDIFKRLAAAVPSDLPGPVLVVGMAETAVGLGAGVHQELGSLTGRSDVVYLSTTRYDLGLPLLAEFSEDHSHAPRHLLYRPCLEEISKHVYGARTLVLVDDEITTGRTMANLHRALDGAGLKHVQRIVLVSITDWSNGAAAHAIHSEAISVSALAGRYRWTPNPDATLPELPNIVAARCVVKPLNPAKNWGRLGVLQHQHHYKSDCRLNERILVLGSGEHVWQPYLLAESLEKKGADVRFSAITRSPIALGNAITSAISCYDNYGEGIANFVYNVDPTAYDRIIVCSETPKTAVDPALLAALGPHAVVFDDGEVVCLVH